MIRGQWIDVSCWCRANDNCATCYLSHKVWAADDMHTAKTHSIACINHSHFVDNLTRKCGCFEVPWIQKPETSKDKLKVLNRGINEPEDIKRLHRKVQYFLVEREQRAQFLIKEEGVTNINALQIFLSKFARVRTKA